MAAFVAGLVVVLVCAAVGLGGGIPALTVFSFVLLVGMLGLLAKVLISVLLHMHGAAGRLKALNDRYDDTERWLEQFDQGTRSIFASLHTTQGELLATAEDLQASIKELQATAGQELQAAVEPLATREALEAAMGSIASDAAKLGESVGRFGKRLDQVSGESKETARGLADSQRSRELIEASVDSVRDELKFKARSIEESIGSIEKGIAAQGELRQEELRSVQQTTEEQLGSVGSRLDKGLAQLEQSVAVSSTIASRLRGDGYVQFTRLVGTKFIERIEGDIGKKLGLSVEQRQVRYLERKVQQIESVCEGRLATTAEDAVARALAARSRKAEELKVLEIGVLFGVGAAFMHTALVPFYKRVELFLLDPFDGYYGAENLDPLTGQSVSRAAVERNMRRAAIDPKDVHFLEGFSTDDAIRKKAKAAGPFDVLVIDGDHSFDGIKADYDRYAEFVDEGGILIVDDYGSKDWPEVTRYVDEILTKDDRFELLGVLSRTAMFRRTPVRGGEAKKAADSKRSTKSSPRISGAKAEVASGATKAKKKTQKKTKKKAAKKTTKKSVAQRASHTAAQSHGGGVVSSRKKPASPANEIEGKPLQPVPDKAG